MNLDIGGILGDWEFVPGQLSVRKIRGRDGRDKIQMRLDLGLLQMEVAGRPDGQRPHGHESLLDYYEDRLRRHRSQNGADETFYLDDRDCELLRAEGLMYYHRYLAAFVLEDFTIVERDTTRNLRLFDFVARYAENDDDREMLDQYRPYVLMMQTRARAHLALTDHRPRMALAIVRKSIEAIRECYGDVEDCEEAETGGEIAVLKALADEIREKIPVDPAVKLQKDLDRAVREERYEEAARLRDKLRTLHTGS